MDDGIVSFSFPFVLGNLVRYCSARDCIGKIREIFPAVEGVRSSEGYNIETPRGDVIYMQHAYVRDATMEDFDLWDDIIRQRGEESKVKRVDLEQLAEVSCKLLRVREWIGSPTDGPFLITTQYPDVTLDLDEESLGALLNILEKKYVAKLKEMGVEVTPRGFKALSDFIRKENG